MPASDGSSSLHSCSKVKNKPQTCQTAQLYSVGPAVCSDAVTITGSRLLSCLQVYNAWCTTYCSVAANTDRPGTVGAPSHFTTAKLVLQQVPTAEAA